MISRRTQTLLTRAHTRLYRLTGGRFGGRLLGMQQVLLTTRGRQSGRPRTTPLSAFPLGAGSSAGSAAATAGALSTGALVLVASDGGRPQHPQWYRNLLADPDVVVQRGRTPVRMRARVATDVERAELWPHVVAAYRGYADYQGRTERQIPLVICEPR